MTSSDSLVARPWWTRLSVWLLAVYWPVLVIVFHMPLEPQPPGPGLPLDKVVHVSAFLVLGALVTWVARPARRASGGIPFTTRMTIFLGLVLYALVDEITQPLTGRSIELGDLAGDAIGALAGISVYHVLVGWRWGQRLAEY